MLNPTLRLACALPLLLAACSNNESPDNAGVSLTADRSSYLVGETATLTPTFKGTTARIEPGIGAVQSGVAVKTPVLSDPIQYRLVVGSGNSEQATTLKLDVDFRNQYKQLDQTLPVSYHASATMSDRSIVVSGGSRSTGLLSDAVNRYDPTGQTWSRIGPLVTGRSEHQMTLLGNGKLLITGGNQSLSSASNAELFDPTTGVSTALSRMLVQRLRHTATLLNDGRVLITGGITNEGTQGGTSISAEIWNPNTQSFTYAGNLMNMPRANHTATLLSNGKVLITGGFATWGNRQYADIFDPTTNTFLPVAGGPSEPPALLAAASRPDGSVWLLGGENQQSSLGSVKAYQYVPTTGALTALADLPAPVSAATSVALGSGDVLLFGGYANAQAISSQAYRISNSTAGSRAIASLPAPRLGHSSHRLPDGRVLIVGGEDKDGNFQRTLVYE